MQYLKLGNLGKMFAFPFCAESYLVSPLVVAEQTHVSANKSKRGCVSNDEYKGILSGVHNLLSVPDWVLQSLKSWTWWVDVGQGHVRTATGVESLQRAVWRSQGSCPELLGSRVTPGMCLLPTLRGRWRKEEPCLMYL